MYKKQMTLQRVLCIVFVACSVLVFVYALGFMTDAYGMINPLDSKTPEMRELMADMDSFDKVLVKVGIGLILVALCLLLTNTHTRRRYYISNYIATGMAVAASCAAIVFAHRNISELRERYYSGIIDFEAVQKALDPHPGRRPPIGDFTESAFWFDAHYFVFGLLLVTAVLLILNAVWKSILMKGEKEALSANKGV